ncbi:MAG: hypothetical protein JST66_12180 [Bacteroidetes bacterium]|nr:hypothetical protein [Bacteroidota bacterium]
MHLKRLVWLLLALLSLAYVWLGLEDRNLVVLIGLAALLLLGPLAFLWLVVQVAKGLGRAPSVRGRRWIFFAAYGVGLVLMGFFLGLL